MKLKATPSCPMRIDHNCNACINLSSFAFKSARGLYGLRGNGQEEGSTARIAIVSTACDAQLTRSISTQPRTLTCCLSPSHETWHYSVGAQLTPAKVCAYIHIDHYLLLLHPASLSISPPRCVRGTFHACSARHQASPSTTLRVQRGTY